LQGLAQHRCRTDCGLHSAMYCRTWTWVRTRFATLCLFLVMVGSIGLGFQLTMCLQTYEQLALQLPKVCHYLPPSPVWTGLPRNILPGACAESTNYRRCNWKCVTGFSQKSASHTLELCAMFATIFPQTPFEQVLSRNLLPEGLCKINQVCAIVYKLMNNCPWNCKCLPLPAHKPRLNRFYPEISFLGGLRKMKQLCAIAYKLINNWPCRWKYLPLPAHKPVWTRFLPRNLLPVALCKTNQLRAIA